MKFARLMIVTALSGTALLGTIGRTQLLGPASDTAGFHSQRHIDFDVNGLQASALGDVETD